MRAGGGHFAGALILVAVALDSAAESAAPVVEAVHVREHRDAGSKSWQRIAIGALAGGDGYVARTFGHGSDIEDGEDGASTELWTFTDAELARAHGQARIALSNVDDGRGSGEWAAVFGGGRDGTPGVANLYVLFIDRGIDGWTSGDFVRIPAGSAVQREDGNQPAFPNALGEPALVDTDLNGTADLAYAGDLQGNLYRFDIADSDPSAWRAVRLFQATHGDPPGQFQPIAQRPFVVMHPADGQFLVVFGTGSGRAVPGMEGTDIQSIYGIWDPGEPDPVTARPGARDERLVRQVLVNVVDESAGAFETRRVLTGNPVNYVVDAPGRTGVYGWFIDLDMPRARQTLRGNPNPDPCGLSPPDPQFPGERVAGRPVARGQVLFMTTVIPGEAQQCDGAPPGSVLAVDIVTGNSLPGGVFDIDGDGRIDAGSPVPDLDDVPVSGVVLGGSAFSGMPGKPVLVHAGDGSATLVVGEGNGALSLGIGGAGRIRTGRLSWREISDGMR